MKTGCFCFFKDREDVSVAWQELIQFFLQAEERTSKRKAAEIIVQENLELKKM
jgi:hypothetical protein